MKKKILIFIITYKASYRLKKIFNLIEFKKLKKYNLKILIIDDNSKFDTIKIAKEIYKKNRSP